jgi:hypothetical protein
MIVIVGLPDATLFLPGLRVTGSWGFLQGIKTQLAYAIWLAVPAVALRAEGDKRPVQPLGQPGIGSHSLQRSHLLSGGCGGDGDKGTRVGF